MGLMVQFCSYIVRATNFKNLCHLSMTSVRKEGGMNKVFLIGLSDVRQLMQA